MSTDWLRCGPTAISDAAVLLALKLDPSGAALVTAIAERTAAVARARAEGLEFGPEEFDDARAAFYSARNLFESEEVAAWLKMHRLTAEAVDEWVREDCVIEAFRRQVASDAVVEAEFRAHRHDYAHAEVEVFSFDTEGKAREFKLAVWEGEIEPEAGEVQEMTRRETPEEIAAALFAAAPGELVGPRETEEETHEVYRLIARTEAELDDDLRTEIGERLFREAVAAEVDRHGMEFMA
ncbi:MAG: hypothetical protein HZA54_01460 [Planctomycetes bacterium]|nr:hypothetical protein [Planctomycetota bacterium]